MTDTPRIRPAAGHRIPDDQWEKIVADAERFAAEPAPEPERIELEDQEPGQDVGGRPRAAGPRTIAQIPPLLDWTAKGRASGKYFPVSGIPTQLIVFHSMEAPLANGYAQSVTSWASPSLAAGGPEASWHRSYGPDYRIHFVPDELGAWHASEANPLSIGLEQTGYAGYTRAQWTTPEGLRMLEGVGYDVAQICKRDGIPARWLTTAEVRAVLDGGNRTIKGFCFHRQIDPETRTDPGNGYPADLALAAVKRYLGTTTPTTDWFDMATQAQLEASIKKVLDANPRAPWTYKGAETKDAWWQLLNIWAKPVKRGGQNVSALQELADTKTLAQQNAAAVKELSAKLDAVLKAVGASAPAAPRAAAAPEEVVVDLGTEDASASDGEDQERGNGEA
jgi:hypothetical protein